MSNYSIKFNDCTKEWEIFDKKSLSYGARPSWSLKGQREAFDFLVELQKQESFKTLVWVIFGVLLLLALLSFHAEAPPYYP